MSRRPALDARRPPFAAAPRAVLLDMDGTLVDTESLWLCTVREKAARFGHQLGEEDMPQVLGRAVADTPPLCTVGRGVPRTRSPWNSMPCFWRRSRGRPPPCQAPSNSSACSRTWRSRRPWCRPLRGPRWTPALKILGAEKFRTTLAEGETSRTKSAADPYLAAARALGVDAAACLAVEDSPTGVASAEAAGCRVLAVPSYAPIAPGPRRTVRRGLTGIGAHDLWTAGLQA